jgi:hypothetical protein
MGWGMAMLACSFCSPVLGDYAGGNWKILGRREEGSVILGEREEAGVTCPIAIVQVMQRTSTKRGDSL